MAATSVVVLDRGNNTTCTINLHGATVVSWRVNNQEQLFVSKLAVFDGKKAIRGGIPFVFPQFGPWSFVPQHGFARITRWALERPPERLHNGDVEALFSLMDNDFTRSMWNYPFRITYRLILREKELHFHIGVYNPSKDLTFSFNLLLHTYLKVPDVQRCQITGLHGCTFIDKTKLFPVIWNPWVDQAREIADFGDDEYPNMVCVESGHVSSPVVLLPGTAFEASQILQVMRVETPGAVARSKDKELSLLAMSSSSSYLASTRMVAPTSSSSSSAPSSASTSNLWPMTNVPSSFSFWNNYPKITSTPSCGGLCGPQTGCNLCSLNV